MSEKTLNGRGGDFLVHMESPQKCLHFGQVTAPNSGGPTNIANVTAFPLLANNVLAQAGDEASVVAFLIAGDPIEDLADDATTTGALYTILDKFDGVVLNQDAIPLTDGAATPGTFNQANIRAATGLASVKWVSEPTKYTTQND